MNFYSPSCTLAFQAVPAAALMPLAGGGGIAGLHLRQDLRDVRHSVEYSTRQGGLQAGRT
jgi:hypothetical protein